MTEVHFDESSTGRSDGPCGWGWIILQDGQIKFAGHGGDHTGTNNTAGLIGAAEGLRAVMRSGILRPREGVTLIGDSQYTLGIANGTYKPSKNLDLANELRNLYLQVGVATRWVPGHRYDKSKSWQEQPLDVVMNERADQLARLGRDENTAEKVLKKRLAKSRKSALI